MRRLAVEDPEVSAAAIASAEPLEGDACRIFFNGSEHVIRFGTAPTVVAVDHEAGDRWGKALSPFRVGDLLLMRRGPPFDGPRFAIDLPRSNGLWAVDLCDPRRFTEPKVELRGADFGLPVIPTDRQRLFFSQLEVLSSLDLDARTADVVGRHPRALGPEVAPPDSEVPFERPTGIAPFGSSLTA